VNRDPCGAFFAPGSVLRGSCEGAVGSARAAVPNSLDRATRALVTERADRRLVAVMFTDMVGYTAMVQADEHLGVEKRDRYWSALETHHEALRGTIVQRLGDGSMSMFPSSLAAVQAAVAIQRELEPHDVPVRIGIHVGEVIVEPERLTGVAVNIAARIESFGVPGGVMLSDSVYEQIQNRSDIGVVGLGSFRLKNVGRPFELYAVSADGVRVPDPGAVEGKGDRFASLPSNLPDPTSPLVGRAADLASLVELAREHRVVTITGPGGVGKTRIVIELGRLLAPEFLDGVAFVALADVTAVADFLPAVADALDVKEAEGRALGEGVVSLIGDKKAVLRARPPHGARAPDVGVEEGRGVLPRGEVLAAGVPEEPQVAAHLQAHFGSRRVAVLRHRQERVERGLEVALIGDAAFEGSDLIGALDAVADLLGERRIPAGVLQRDLARLARGLEPLTSELSDRLQHPEPVTLAVGLHEGLVDERLQFVKGGLAGVCADGFEIGEGAPSGEDGHAPEQALLRFR
jgi:class 3 adenylate cyclase